MRADVMAPLLLIGEAPGGKPNSPVPSNHRPLFPLPRGCAGHRLCDLMGMDRGVYVWGTERMNLLYWTCSPDPWPADRARQRAEGLAAWMYQMRDEQRGRVWAILCGARVRDAFGLREAEQLSWYRDGRLSWMVIPHPSGRSLAWNDQAVRARFREGVAEALPDVRAYLDRRREKHFVHDAPLIPSQLLTKPPVQLTAPS